MNTLSRKHLYLHSLLTGVLLALGWPARGFPLLLLVGFVPILITEHYFYLNRDKKTAFSFLWFTYIAMLLWNVLTTWWVCNSTIVGGLAALICNSFFMAIVLMLFHIVKRRAGMVTGYASLPILWLAFEYVHLHWQLSWPWLTLGFGFSNYVSLIQWYTLTGPLGGTLWILLCNIAIFHFVYNKFLDKEKPRASKNLYYSLSLVVIPILISLAIYYIHDFDCKKQTGVNIVVVQPNIDPYNEKFSGNYQSQLDKMFALADTKVDNSTDYLVFPETALTDPDIVENNMQSNKTIQSIWAYMHKHPNLSLVTGAGTFRTYNKGDSMPPSARNDEGLGYYDAYNTALQFDSSKNIQIYHKCKLVPGVEFMPFAKYLAPLAKLAFDLGGTSGTLGTQKEPSVFYSSHAKTTIAPAICYESIYGDYIGKYIQKGAQLIFVITNDGWWKDTPGYRQHLCYAAMLAVETRKDLVQCANTGFSGFINDKGDISQKTNWWEPAVIQAWIHPSTGITFYSLHGDYLGLCSCYLSVLLIGFIFSMKIISYFRPKSTT